VNAWRYALYGLLIGLGLPVVATLAEMQHHGGDLLAAQAGSPLLWIVDTTPLVVALVAWMAGHRQDQLAEMETARAAAFARTADDLSAAAAALFQSVSAFSAMTADTAAAVRGTTQTVNALSQTAMRAALTAETVIGLAQKSARSSEDGLRAVEVSASGTARLADEVQAWASRTETLAGRTRAVLAVAAAVGEIADRSEALAAEARAEAERAGEAGQGFAGVAGELAAHAAAARDATAKVQALIGEMEGAVAAALAAMEAGRQESQSTAQAAAGAGRTIQALAATIRDSSAAAKEIATVAQQQDRGIEETLKAMNGIYLAVQEAAAQTARVAAQARGISDLAAGLKSAGRISP
jgi:methyl-accepting chemotaxis protein